MLLLQFVGGVIVTLEEAQDGHVAQGAGGGVKMVHDRKVLLIIVYRAHMLCELVTESVLEETTSGTTDTGDQVGRCTGEPLLDMGLEW
eukprot:g24446.t1